MTDKDAVKLRTRARIYALRMGFDEDAAEDLAQDAIVMMLASPWRATVKQVVIECIRHQYGRVGKKNIKTHPRNKLLRDTRPGCGDYKERGKWKNKIDIEPVDPWGQVDAGLDLAKFFERLDELERKVVTDHHLHGFRLVEIATEMNYSAPWATLFMQDVMKVLREIASD